VPKLQTVGWVCQYLRWQRGYSIPSSAAFGKIGAAYVDHEHRFAQAHGIPMLHFAKGENEEQLAWPLIDKAAAEGGAGRVVLTEPGDELPENSWCNADLDLPNAGLHGEIPTLRCVMPTREQRELPTDIQVIRTLAKHANGCLGNYATVSSPGTIGVGDEIVVRRPASSSRPTAMTRVSARSLKRGVLRALTA